MQQHKLFWSYLLGPEGLAGRVGALGLASALIAPSAPCPYRCLPSPFLAGRSQGIPVLRDGFQISLFIFSSQVKSPKHSSIQVISLLMALHGLSHSVPDSHPALCCLFSPKISCKNRILIIKNVMDFFHDIFIYSKQIPNKVT